MGQTLTHGVYLPDEGERNCYSGLAANWQILDSSVGTIAEHTTQIAGKAPLVHTHVKSDITDLLNSNFIPSANNSYDLGSSSYQWNNLYAKKVNTQSVNGVNPGALSLPSGGTTENTDWFDVAGDILPTGGNATSFSRATANYFTPAKDGWLALTVKNCSDLSVWCMALKYGISIIAPDASLSRQVVIPVVAGKSYQILITGNSWASARLIMPQGNV